MIPSFSNLNIRNSLKRGFHLLYILLVLVQISDVLIPIQFNNFTEDLVEITENAEKESKEKKKGIEENDTDVYVYQMKDQLFSHQLRHQPFGDHGTNFSNRAAEIFSPPPELI